MASGKVVAVAPFQGDELPGDELRTARRHEIKVAGIPRRDHGHSQRHRFSKGETESFGAMEADKRVCFVVESIELFLTQQGLDPADAGISGCQVVHGLGLFRKLFGAAGFDQQLNGWLILRIDGKGHLEGADDRFRVFAFRGAPEIEKREKGERVRALALQELLLSQLATLIEVRPVG